MANLPNQANPISRISLNNFLLAVASAWSLGFIIVIFATLTSDEKINTAGIMVQILLMPLPWVWYYFYNKFKANKKFMYGSIAFILIIIFIGIAADNGSSRQRSGGNSMTTEAEQQISAQTGSAAVGTVVDQLEMKGTHNEVLWTDCLIEVKSDNKYFYVLHREGSGTIPSFTRPTTWPYSVTPIRNKKTLRGMLMNG